VVEAVMRSMNLVVLAILQNTTINQEAETEGIVMLEPEGNNSESIVTTEMSVSMITRQLQDLLNNVITTLRADVKMTET